MSINDLFSEIVSEIEEESERAMTQEERDLHALSKKLLLLERDLRAPGSVYSSDARIDRLLEAISKEAF